MKKPVTPNTAIRAALRRLVLRFQCLCGKVSTPSSERRPNMGKFVDLTGRKYARLLVLGLHSKAARAHTFYWKCRCDCGKEIVAMGANVKSGHTKSCGCFQEETRGQHTITHGGSSSKCYCVWKTMIQRCTNPNHDKYKYYGGRGITVCESWKKFANFRNDMGDPPDGLQIDRIDNSSGYQPSNCRWVTKSVNMRNRRGAVKVMVNGEGVPAMTFAETNGLPYHYVRRRVHWGLSGSEILVAAQKRRIRR